jgi:hypothetical protein
MNTYTSKTGAALLGLLLVMSMLSYVSALSVDTDTGVDLSVNAGNSATTGNAAVTAGADTSVSADGGGRAVIADARAGIVEARKNAARTAKEFALGLRTEREAQATVESQATIESKLREIDSSVRTDLKASSFAIVSRGEGWATNATDGSFVRIMIVQKTFVDADDNETVRARGVLKLNGRPAYNLVMTSETDSEMVFDVRSNNEIVGKLTLTEETEVGAFTSWKGTLDLESGNDLVIRAATIDNKLRATADAESNATVDADARDEIKDARKEVREARKGLFASLRDLFRTRAQANAQVDATVQAD